MIKRILSALFCATMFFTLSITTFADDLDALDMLDEYEDVLQEDSAADENAETDVATTDNESKVIDNKQQARLVDDADVLPSEDSNVLFAKLNDISNDQKFDVAIILTSSLNNNTSVEAAAKNYYLEYGYGMGENKDGALLLLVIDTQEYSITTNGYGNTVITDAGSERMIEFIKPYLEDGEYYKACDKFADLCEDYITQANTGKPYDTSNLPKLPKGEFPFWKKLGISMIAGAIIAFIIVSIMKSKLTTVKAQDSAADYTKEGSMVINESRDMFLYSHVSKTEKPKDSGGGSSVRHTSSGSFRSHSGKW